MRARPRSQVLAAMLACISAAACFHDEPGLLLEIKTTTAPGPHHVELYVSERSCGSECASITPPSQTPQSRPAVSGTGWIVDDDARFFIDTTEPGVVRFQLQAPGDMPARVKRLLIVDADSTGVPRGAVALGPLDIPQASSEITRVTLNPADAIGSPTDNEHLLRWPRRTASGTDDAKTACAIIAHPSNDTEFFVPELDHDCDGASTECRDYAYLVDVPPTIDTANCMVSSTTCHIGGPTCFESKADNLPTCSPLTSPAYCLPHNLCSVQPTPCLSWDRTCIGSKIPGALISMPRVECSIHIDPNGTVCSGGKGMLEASAIVWDSPSQACAKVELGTMDAPPRFGSSATLDGHTISRSSVDPTRCTAQLDVSGTFQNGEELIGMIDVVTTAGGHRVVPMLLAASAVDCSTGTVAGIQCIGNTGGSGDPIYSSCP